MKFEKSKGKPETEKLSEMRRSMYYTAYLDIKLLGHIGEGALKQARELRRRKQAVAKL